MYLQTITKLAMYFLLAVVATACGGTPSTDPVESDIEDIVRSGPEAPLTANQRAWVDRTLRELTIREMAAQVLMPHVSPRYTPVESDEFDDAAALVARGVGGLALYGGGPPVGRAAKTNELQQRARVPLLISGGEIGWGPLYGGMTDLPGPIAYGAIGEETALREAGRITGAESRAVGTHLVFTLQSLAINLNKSLVWRSFGAEPAQTGDLAAAYIRGVHEEGALAYATTFPGGGALQVDPHVRLVVLDVSRERLDTREWVPFRRSFAAGVDFLMTSHIALPAVTGSDSIPTTLSAEVISTLRGDLGFRGVVITDAMSMGGIANHYDRFEAAIGALRAGHDMVLGPPPYAGIEVADTIAAAVQSGRLSVERLTSAVRRILEAKARLGLHEHRTVPLDAVDDVVGRRAHRRSAERAAVRSIVLLRDADETVPLADPLETRVLSVTFAEERTVSAGRRFDEALGEQVKAIETLRLSPASGSEPYDALQRKAMAADLVTISVYMRPGATTPNIHLSPPLVRAVRRLRESGVPTVLLSFGKMNLLEDLPEAGCLLMAWTYQDVMQNAAAQALLGEAAITGTLPLSLSPHHQIGEGIQRPGPAHQPR